ncbi:hypothetical protein [Nocardiopsis synnemataformans]|uniref:hypothetical protein n=1 Tax=Nocardiopsis synnemataformans TaxID=61305 RepID=UPI003EB7C51B
MAESYSARRARQIAYGQWEPWGDLDAVKARVARWRAQGHTCAHIARCADVALETIIRIPTRTKLAKHTADKILEADVGQLPPAGYMIADPARRQLRALGAIGYSGSVLAPEIGLSRETLGKIASGRQSFVQVAHARAITKAFSKFADRPLAEGKSARLARTHAARNDYAPPAAYDSEWWSLSDFELNAEVTALARQMSDAEVGRCYTATLAGDPSPLVRAGSIEHLRRLSQRRAAS